MNNIYFYNIFNIPNNIEYPDIYFTPEYGKACEYSDDALWECCIYKDLMYVYLKKQYKFNNDVYYDLLTPYGYSGYFFKNKDTFDKFIPLFREEAKKRNYLTEVVRQNPYMNMDISRYYDTITSKKIFGVKIKNYEDYYINTLSSKKRNIIKKAIKQQYCCESYPITMKLLKTHFIDLYYKNMDRVNSTQYYYFNDEYFKQFENIQNSRLIVIFDADDKIIGSSFIIIYDDYVHYHLSCNDKSSNCITDFLLDSIIKQFGKNKTVILGGGISDNDSLSLFKKKISTDEYDYTIYKNILNQEIYEQIKQLYPDSEYFPAHRG